jgi:hypothetical protein
LSPAAGDIGAAVRRAGRLLARTLVDPPLPLVAVEVRPGALGAVRLEREGRRLSLGAAATVDLPEGALEVSLARPNLTDPEAFGAALRAVLERAGALAGGDVSLVLPDPAVRLALVPSEGLRGRRGDAEEVLRFRLHKALPPDLDARTARLAWQPAGPDQVLVAVASDEVVRGYEEALEALGFRVGLVEPAGLALAALEGTDVDGDGLLVNWDRGYVSFLVRRRSRPLLQRTLPREDSPEAVARQAAQTLRFCREHLDGDGFKEVVVRSAVVPGPEAGALLAKALGAAPRLVRPWAAVGVLEDGPAAQAVAGAAACVLRRAA